MEQTANTSKQEQPFSQVKKAKTVFLVVSLICAFVILLAVVVGILIYFKPFKTLPNNSPLESETTTQPETITSTTLGTTYSKADLEKSVSEMLQNQYLPANIPVKTIQDKSITVLEMAWEKNNISFTANLYANTQLAGLFTIAIQTSSEAAKSNTNTLLANNEKQTIASPLADSLSGNFFQRPGKFSNWNCDTTNKRVFCMQTQKSATRIYAIGVRENIFNNNPGPFTLTACSAPITNQLAKDTPSCL